MMGIHPLRQEALDYYFSNDVTHKEVVKHFNNSFGLTTLYAWIKADERFSTRRNKNVYYSDRIKQEAIMLYTIDKLSCNKIQQKLGIGAHTTVLRWIIQYKNTGIVPSSSKVSKVGGYMAKYKKPKDENSLEYELFQVRLERDILQAALEECNCPKVIGLNLCLSVERKAQLINKLRPKYKLRDLLIKMNLSKSSYYYSTNSYKKSLRYESATAWVMYVYETKPKHVSNFGYRKVQSVLHKIDIHISDKIVRCIIRDNLLNPTITKKRHYSSYKGTVGTVAPNTLNRNFTTDEPNKQYGTDITEYKLKNGEKVYFSPMKDMYNSEIVGYSLSTHPNMKLVMDMLDMTFSKLSKDDNPLIHSDQGHHYQRDQYVNALKTRNITQSMSRKATSPDNATTESLFGVMKQESFYANKELQNMTPDEFIDYMHEYIYWYNNNRPSNKLGGKSPVEYRLSNEQDKCAMIVPDTKQSIIRKLISKIVPKKSTENSPQTLIKIPHLRAEFCGGVVRGSEREVVRNSEVEYEQKRMPKLLLHSRERLLIALTQMFWRDVSVNLGGAE
jgi:putative transposase